MARQLREQGDAAELLLLIECYPPDYGSRGRAGRIARRILRGPVQWRALLAHWRELRELARRIRLAKACHTEGRPLPDDLRTPEWYSRIASHNFKPRPYSGRVVLFEANGSLEPMMGWSGVLDPATEVHTITTDQRGMMTKDATGELAQRLALLLR
jgi:thioesterase domain-containing protein